MSNGIKNKTRVAFLLLGGQEWLGGYNYLRNLSQALVHYEEEIIPVIFAGSDVSKEMLAPFLEMKIEVIEDKVFDKEKRAKHLFKSLLLGKIAEIEVLFERCNIDVAFENNLYFGWRTHFNVISWLPDFQHKHLPSLFSRLAWWKREMGFRMITHSSRIIMLSSEDAKKDCQNFYRVPSSRIFVVPFAVEPPAIDALYVKECLDKYHIKVPFFYLPNQFWRHKNHKIVIKALALLNKRSENKKRVISSGSSKDERKMSYFDEIETLIKEKNLEGSFEILGTIPYRDVIHLMFASVAVINPSLFEGWSTTVEEAKSLKKPLIVSHIGVHQEQVGEEAFLFDPHNEESLSHILETFPMGSSLRLSSPLLIDNTQSVKIYTQKFKEMIETIKVNEQ